MCHQNRNATRSTLPTITADSGIMLTEEIVPQIVASQITGRWLLNQYRSTGKCPLQQTRLHTVFIRVAIADWT